MASHAAMLESLRSNDASKRKRVNRTARLKQWKRDARREQWLSHGKQDRVHGLPVGGGAFFGDEIKSDPGEVVDPESESHSTDIKRIISTVCRQPERMLANPNEQEGRTVRSHVRVKRAETDVGSVEGLSKQEPLEALQTDFGYLNTSMISCMSDCSEADSSPKSYRQNSPKSKVTKLEMDFGPRTDEGVHCHASEDDWEAVADALDAQMPPVAKCPPAGSSKGDASLRSVHESSLLDKQSVPISPSKAPDDLQYSSLKPECKCKRNTQTEKLRSSSGRAWRPDDTSRPSSLPRLKKQQSLPADHVPQAWASSSNPAHCPICIEEFDSTDSSFTPCICGFQLCLFCHNRILLEDGRCPGCRKTYDTHLAAKLPRSVNA